MTLLIAYILNIIDYLFTAHWVRLYGIDIERNPLGRWMFSHNIAWVFKILIVGIFFAVLGICIHIRPDLAWVTYIPLITYGLIALHHVVILLHIAFNGM